jgi:uncharacterized membrane protein
MAPLLVQLVVWIAARAGGAAGVLPAGASAAGAMRVALAAMFLFTAVSHFHPRTRAELVAMVPPRLPAPRFLVSLTGILEAVGAIGLLLPVLVRPAALALAALLLAMFPANVHAARAGLRVAGRPAMSLRLRLPLQAFWVACLIWVALAHASTR